MAFLAMVPGSPDIWYLIAECLDASILESLRYVNKSLSLVAGTVLFREVRLTIDEALTQEFYALASSTFAISVKHGAIKLAP